MRKIVFKIITKLHKIGFMNSAFYKKYLYNTIGDYICKLIMWANK